ncbi:MAG: hypothetical protein ACJ76H_15285 [Bacteriovoracaceae bacterium]
MDWNLPSEIIDERLGLRVKEIESDLLRRAQLLIPKGDHHSWGAALHEGNQTWVGLHPETIQTPYAELARMCRKLSLKNGDHVVDLGAGYGRLGFVLQDLYPAVTFLGLEFVHERVLEGQRIYRELGLDPKTLTEGDLTAENYFPEEATHYFLYDFGKVPHIRRILLQLGEIADRKKFTLIGRGKGVRSLISHEFPWLTVFYAEENFSIYSI